MAALQRRDQHAIANLYDSYASSLFGVIFRIVRSEEVAEDTLQEVFVKIWNSIGTYDRSKGRLFTWLVNVARNAAIDTTRSKAFKTMRKGEDIDTALYNDKALTTSMPFDRIGLKEIVDGLKPEHKVLIDMVYFNGYTQLKVSKELAIPLGTVKTRIKIAIRELREIVT